MEEGKWLHNKDILFIHYYTMLQVVDIPRTTTTATATTTNSQSPGGTCLIWSFHKVLLACFVLNTPHSQTHMHRHTCCEYFAAIKVTRNNVYSQVPCIRLSDNLWAELYK